MNNWAAIFDWDGVIIDSSIQHERGWQLLAEQEGLPLPPNFFRKSFGMKNEMVIPELLKWTHDPVKIQDYSLRKEALYRKVALDGSLELLPGVKAWLEILKAAEIPCAIGSSTIRINIEAMIDLLGIRSYFQTIISGEDVTRGKPDPAVFLLAAQRLHTPPARCVVFEDAHVGIEAARAGGMKVVALSTTHPPETLHDADRVIANLSELKLAELDRWFS